MTSKTVLQKIAAGDQQTIDQWLTRHHASITVHPITAEDCIRYTIHRPGKYCCAFLTYHGSVNAFCEEFAHAIQEAEKRDKVLGSPKK